MQYKSSVSRNSFSLLLILLAPGDDVDTHPSLLIGCTWPLIGHGLWPPHVEIRPRSGNWVQPVSSSHHHFYCPGDTWPLVSMLTDAPRPWSLTITWSPGLITSSRPSSVFCVWDTMNNDTRPLKTAQWETLGCCCNTYILWNKEINVVVVFIKFLLSIH